MALPSLTRVRCLFFPNHFLQYFMCGSFFIFLTFTRMNFENASLCCWFITKKKDESTRHYLHSNFEMFYFVSHFFFLSIIFLLKMNWFCFTLHAQCTPMPSSERHKITTNVNHENQIMMIHFL